MELNSGEMITLGMVIVWSKSEISRWASDTIKQLSVEIIKNLVGITTWLCVFSIWEIIR